MAGATISHLLIIAAGGALGAVGRYLAVAWVATLHGSRFPWGTFGVNALGSFLLGLCFVLVVERLNGHPELRSLVMVGFLGAFTTFSTFSVEAVQLLAEKAYAMAAGYVGGSVVVCIAAAALGIWSGRQWLP